MNKQYQKCLLNQCFSFMSVCSLGLGGYLYTKQLLQKRKLEKIRNMWPAITSYMRQKNIVSNASDEYWIKPLVIDRVEGDKLYFLVLNDKIKEYMERHYTSILKDIIKDMTGIELNPIFQNYKDRIVVKPN